MPTPKLTSAERIEVGDRVKKSVGYGNGWDYGVCTASGARRFTVAWWFRSTRHEHGERYSPVKPVTPRDLDAIDELDRQRGYRFIVEGCAGDEMRGESPNLQYAPWFVRREVPDGDSWSIDDTWADGGCDEGHDSYAAAVAAMVAAYRAVARGPR